jgi:hypothetical protein
MFPYVLSVQSRQYDISAPSIVTYAGLIFLKM